MFVTKNKYNDLVYSYDKLKKSYDVQQMYYDDLLLRKEYLNTYVDDKYTCLSKAYVEFIMGSGFEIECEEHPIKFYKSDNNLIYNNNNIIHTISLTNVKYYSNELAVICKDNCFGCINFNHGNCEKGKIKIENT